MPLSNHAITEMRIRIKNTHYGCCEDFGEQINYKEHLKTGLAQVITNY